MPESIPKNTPATVAAAADDDLHKAVRSAIADLSKVVEYAANNNHRDFLEKVRAVAEKLETAANKPKS